MPTRRKLAAASVVLLAASLAGAGPSPSKAPQPQPAVKAEPLPERAIPNPIQTVRVFSALQERIVNGSSEALQGQAGLAREIGARLLKFDAAVWKDARNREAAIKFALMGGDPRVIEELLEQKVFEGDEASLADGAMAFAYGDRKRAEAELGKIEPRTLTPSLGGYVALIMAVLIGPADPLKALALCDEARLLSPGTPVEEAALRLSIELAILAGSPGRFDAALIHHLRRFPGSLYARTVDARIARVLAARGMKPGIDVPPLAAIVADYLPLERRQGLLEDLLKAALRGGAVSTAAFAAGQLRALAPDNAAVLDLCRAAEAAHAMFGGRRAEARALLAEPTSEATPEEVGALLGEMQALVSVIEEAPRKGPEASELPAAASERQADPGPDRLARFVDLAKRVETVIGEADKLLGKAGS